MNTEAFRKPDSILRPAPFWAINDRLDPNEVARQMADMIRVGLSGGFFHSRHGLITDYLGEEWFASMRAALQAAKEHDGYLWLYDEDLWPSGNAGGQVAGMKDEYRAATLNAILVAPDEPEPTLHEDQALRACYAIKKRDRLTLLEAEQVPLDRLESARPYERLFLVRTYQPKTGWWGGESYANLLHPEAMREFIRLTHERYYRELGEEFGKRIPGIFTDEPQVPSASNGFAWYEGLPERYREWTGRDFWRDLPYMFFDGAEARKIRLLMHRTILRQFLEAYSKPIYEWCEQHGLEHTGHYNAEDTFHGQIVCHYGGIMAHYRYQQAPGIDHLCRVAHNHLFTVKQVSSAARQLGRKRVLTEIFGVSRHTNTFEDFKWLGDYDLVLGANFFCPHLTWYSGKGRRKRDYPPNWNYQQTYWDELKPLNDYFTRVAYALTRGKASVDILLLHSIESATAARRFGVEVQGQVQENARRTPLDVPTADLRAADELDALMRKTLDAILNAGYDCDLGDEGYIEDMGRVEGDRFIIGEMGYQIVVVPPATTWRPKSYELLKQFAHNGGKVILLGELPTELDCEPAREKWLELANHPNVRSLPCAVEAIQNAIDEIAPGDFTLKGSDGKAVPMTYLQHRIDGEEHIFFIVNSDRNAGRDYVLTLKGAAGKPVLKWDAVQATCQRADVRQVGNDLRYEFSLPPCGSLLLTVGADVPNAQVEEGLPDLRQGEVIPFPPEFDFTRTDWNVLVMDRMSVSFDDGKTFGLEDYEWRVRHALAQRFGTEETLQWQPWVAIRKRLFEGKGGDIVLRYRFLSDLEQPKSYVVIEDLYKGRLTVNGHPIRWDRPEDLGWYWDKGFQMAEITSLVQRGENIVDFAVHYDFLTEVETAYVVGDFGVAMVDPFRAKLVEEPKRLKVGSWSRQGYPFYTGRMVYRAEFAAPTGKRLFLRLMRPSGTLFKVRLNGKEAGSILWRPYLLELTPLVQPDQNRLEIEVVSSLQNAWGPLHEKNGDDNLWAGPNAFQEEWFLREELNSFNYGLLGGAELVAI